MKVLSVFGTRPEAIKMAPVIKALEKHDDKIISRICVTAQHRQMLDQVLRLFQINPDYDLDIMQDRQEPLAVAAMLFQKIDGVFKEERPDWVLVQGDTATVMAAAVAAFYSRIKVGHVEAGLRTHDRYHPFPEEINRRIAGVTADLHFTPTKKATENLLKENVPAGSILCTGNTVIDALNRASAIPYNCHEGPLKDIDWRKRIVLVTAHRRENFGRPLENICGALAELSRRYRADTCFVYPVHMNPHVRETVFDMLGDRPDIQLLPPLDYHPFVHLMKRCFMAVTDSGGIQEEAPALGKPVLVLRDVTERPEAVAAGTAEVIGTDKHDIIASVSALLDNSERYRRMATAENPYGDGRAAERIVDALLARRALPLCA